VTAGLSLVVLLVGRSFNGSASDVLTGLVAVLVLAVVLDGRLAQRRAAVPVRRELSQIRADLTTVRQQVRRVGQEVTWARRHAKAGRQALGTLGGRLAATERTLVDLGTKGGYPWRERLRDGRQAEALHNLYALLQPRQAVPPLRGWAASPDLVLLLVSHVLEHRPRTVVECGSGASTLWTSYALERVGGGRVLSLEHDPVYADQTRSLLARHGLSAYAEVATAPLTPVTIGEESWRWYDPAALASVSEVDLLIVDGPPAATGPLARYPAVPLLFDRLAADAVVVLDDAVRKDEREIAARWAAATGLTVELLKGLDKQALILRRPGTART
jgi:predicted O-methyltransferase YrrM